MTRRETRRLPGGGVKFSGGIPVWFTGGVDECKRNGLEVRRLQDEGKRARSIL